MVTCITCKDQARLCVLQHEIGTYQTVFETRSLQQVRNVRDPLVFMTKAHNYYGLCEYPGDRHCEVGKMEGGVSGLRAHEVWWKPPKSFKNRMHSGGNNTNQMPGLPP